MNMTWTCHIHPMSNLTCLTWLDPSQDHNRTESRLLIFAMLMVLFTFCFHANDAWRQKLVANGWTFHTFDGWIHKRCSNHNFWCTPWWTNIAIENGPVEIVDFPIQNGGSFHGKMLVYQAGYHNFGPPKRPPKTAIQEHSWTRTEGPQRSTLVFIVLLATGATTRDPRWHERWHRFGIGKRCETPCEPLNGSQVMGKIRGNSSMSFFLNGNTKP